jgi:hypothetical protein
MIAGLACPNCHRDYVKPVRIVAETPRRAGKRPATPELISTCPNCGGMHVLSLHPAHAPKGMPR